MTQTLWLVVLFVAAIAMLPWLVRRVQQKQGGFSGVGGSTAPRVLSAIAVGPHQRVVTVEIGIDGERTTLVLGVTPQNIQCLLAKPSAHAPGASGPSFSQEMAQASAGVAPPSKEG